MKVRRYVAATVPEAMAQVKEELGLDAVILHTHSIRQGGFLGFFGRKMVEVTAAIEEDLPPRPAPQNEPTAHRQALARTARDAYRSSTTISTPRVTTETTEVVSRGLRQMPDVQTKEPHETEDLQDFLSRFREHLNEEQVVSGYQENEGALRSQTPIEVTQAPVNAKIDEMSDIRLELRQTQELLRQIVQQREEPKLEKVVPELPKTARRFWQQLVANDVDADLATELLHGVLAGSPSTREQEIEELLRQRVLELMQQAIPEQRPSGKPEVVALVGPTGVGKTTTLAKLAAYAALVEKKKVGLITIDTYRIAAVEQLKTYAKILNLQVQVVFTPQELPEVLAQMADFDIVFLDTAGRSHKNAMQMSELKAFFDVGKPTRSYLVLSLTTKYTDMMEIVSHFEPLNLDTLIFTKLDETSTYGNLFNLVVLLQKKVAYLTNGQSVPEDINPVDLQAVTDLVLGKRSYA